MTEAGGCRSTHGEGDGPETYEEVLAFARPDTGRTGRSVGSCGKSRGQHVEQEAPDELDAGVVTLCPRTRIVTSVSVTARTRDRRVRRPVRSARGSEPRAVRRARQEARRGRPIEPGDDGPRAGRGGVAPCSRRGRGARLCRARLADGRPRASAGTGTRARSASTRPRRAPSRDESVHVRVASQIGRPGVQHARDAEPRVEALPPELLQDGGGDAERRAVSERVVNRATARCSLGSVKTTWRCGTGSIRRSCPSSHSARGRP